MRSKLIITLVLIALAAPAAVAFAATSSSGPSPDRTSGRARTDNRLGRKRSNPALEHDPA